MIDINCCVLDVDIKESTYRGKKQKGVRDWKKGDVD